MICSAQELGDYLQRLNNAAWIAVDTEADSLHAYPEKVCLIQVSTASEDRLLDPLAGFDLAPLLDALAKRQIIMHGADYDLRLLRKHHNFVPIAIFDTMLAARLLGMTRFSLSDLVESLLHVKLEKGPQKANWAMRPLTERMEAYARNDTRHLKPLSDKLAQDLRSKGRIEWHRECCDRLIVDCAQEHAPDPDLVWRVKGSSRLSRPALAILRELWRWREAEAVRANKPPYFILSHETLTRIADEASQNRPVTAPLPRNISDRRKTALMAAVAKGAAVPPDRQPRIPRNSTRRPSDQERKKYAELQAIRDANAAKLGMDPTLIANRTMLSDLALDWEKHAAGIMRWQRHLLEQSLG